LQFLVKGQGNQVMDDMKIALERDFAHNTYYLRMKSGNLMAQPIVFSETREGDFCPPCVSLSETACQALLNELWAQGFRPSDDIGSVGELKATNKHLSDMRAIAFHKLNISQTK
jgi:hypothetical protein